MIVFNLSCELGHLFEGWFASSEDYERQRAQALVRCPICESAHIERKPTAPRLNLGRGDVSSADDDSRGHAVQRAVMQAVRAMVDGSEDVGDRFADEARRMHAAEAPERSIRGTATPSEAQALRDEGIDVLPLPMAEMFKKPLQ